MNSSTAASPVRNALTSGSAHRADTWLLCAVVVVVVLLAAGGADACPSCADPRDTARNAMIGSTIFLSLLPLGFIGAVVTWVVRRERAISRQRIQAP